MKNRASTIEFPTFTSGLYNKSFKGSDLDFYGQVVKVGERWVDLELVLLIIVEMPNIFQNFLKRKEGLGFELIKNFLRTSYNHNLSRAALSQVM